MKGAPHGEQWCRNAQSRYCKTHGKTRRFEQHPLVLHVRAHDVKGKKRNIQNTQAKGRRDPGSSKTCQSQAHWLISWSHQTRQVREAHMSSGDHCCSPKQGPTSKDVIAAVFCGAPQSCNHRTSEGGAMVQSTLVS